MRTLLLVFCCAMMLLPYGGSAQSAPKAQPKGAHVKFEKTAINFGEVSRNGENQRCVFRFVNDGTEPLVILSAITSCSCVKANFSRKPIAVGEKGTIELLIEVKKMEKGLFHRVVQVRSNSVGGTENLTIEGVAKD